MKVLQERFPYRVVEKSNNDQIIEKYDPIKKKYFTMYVFGCELQMMTALEDHEYVKWLDPSNPPCYVKDCVGNY